VRVRVDEPGYDGAAPQIDEARAVSRQAPNVRTGADFRDAVPAYRAGLGDVEGGIEGHDIPAVQDQVGTAHEQ
jgi:hypothetical protein